MLETTPIPGNVNQSSAAAMLTRNKPKVKGYI